MFTRLTFSVLSLSLTTAVLSASKASAHSDYWRCAAASGSNEAAQANCGSRADYDRTGELGGANAPSEAQRQARRDEEERQRQDNMRREREEDDRRRDQARRDEDDRRRRDDDDRRRRIEQDEEDSRRRRNDDDSYERESRGRQPSRRSRQAETPVVYEDVVVPVEVNLNQPSINLGTVMNVAGNRGLRVKSITVETSTPGGSRVSVLAGGVRVGSIVAQQPGEYEKTFSISRGLAKSGSRLTLASQGDVTVLRVTLVVGR